MANKATFVFFVLFLVSSVMATNLVYAEVNPVATNQKGQTLSNVEFSVYCGYAKYTIYGQETRLLDCKGPNENDCNLPNKTISKIIMAYCPAMENYGLNGYKFLKENALRKYVGVCKK